MENVENIEKGAGRKREAISTFYTFSTAKTNEGMDFDVDRENVEKGDEY